MNKLLSILLQKSDPDFPWGFEVVGGRDKSTPLTIDVVKSGTLASQYLQPGDRVLQINETDSALLTQHEATQLISKPSKCLELLVLKFTSHSSAEGANKNTYRLSKPPKYQSPKSNQICEDIRENEEYTSDRAVRVERQPSHPDHLQHDNDPLSISAQSHNSSFSHDRQSKYSCSSYQNLESTSAKSQNVESRQSSCGERNKQSSNSHESQFQSTQMPQQGPGVPERQFHTSENSSREERISYRNSQAHSSTVNESEQYYASNHSSNSAENYALYSNSQAQPDIPYIVPWRNSRISEERNAQQPGNFQTTNDPQNGVRSAQNFMNAQANFNCLQNEDLKKVAFSHSSDDKSTRSPFLGNATDGDSPRTERSNASFQGKIAEAHPEAKFEHAQNEDSRKRPFIVRSENECIRSQFSENTMSSERTQLSNASFPSSNTGVHPQANFKCLRSEDSIRQSFAANSEPESRAKQFLGDTVSCESARTQPSNDDSRSKTAGGENLPVTLKPGDTRIHLPPVTTGSNSTRIQSVTPNLGITRQSVPDLRSILPRSTYPKLKQPKDFQPKTSYNYYENFKLRSSTDPRIQRSISEPSGSQAPSLSSTPDGGSVLNAEPIPPRNESARIPLRDRLTDPYYQFFNEKRRTFHEGEMSECSFSPLRKSCFRSSNPQLNEERKTDDRSWRASSYSEESETGTKKTGAWNAKKSEGEIKNNSFEQESFQSAKSLVRSKASAKPSANYVRCNSSIPFFSENTATDSGDNRRIDSEKSARQADNFYYTATTTNFKPAIFPFPVETNSGNNKDADSNIKVDLSTQEEEGEEEEKIKGSTRRDCFSPYDNISSEILAESSVDVKRSIVSEEMYQHAREGKFFNRDTQRWEYSTGPFDTDSKVNIESISNESNAKLQSHAKLFSSKDSLVSTGSSFNTTEIIRRHEGEKSSNKTSEISAATYQNMEERHVSSNDSKSNITEFSNSRQSSNNSAVVLNNFRVDSNMHKTDDSKLHLKLNDHTFKGNQNEQSDSKVSKESFEEKNLDSTNFDVYINHFDSSVNAADYIKYQTKCNAQRLEENNSIQKKSVNSNPDSQFFKNKIVDRSQAILSDDQSNMCFNEIKYNLSKLCDDGIKYSTAEDKIEVTKDINSEQMLLNREAEISHQKFKSLNVEQKHVAKDFEKNERRCLGRSQDDSLDLTIERQSKNYMAENSSEKTIYKENQFYENFMTADQHDITRHFQHVFSDRKNTFDHGGTEKIPEKTVPCHPKGIVPVKTDSSFTKEKTPEKFVHFQQNEKPPEKAIPSFEKERAPDKTIPSYQKEKTPERIVTSCQKGISQSVASTINETKKSMDPAPWRRQSQQISGNNSSSSYPIHTDTVDGAPPPPPPPLNAGAIPAVRLKSEIPERGKEPPAAIQNAMLTKDKKPFTYTPGGLDLSEIRSPRMARRITRNQLNPEIAHLPPTPQETQQSSLRQPLPPAALAAMQPAIPVSVFPQQQVPITRQYGGDRSSKVNPSTAPPPPAPPAPPAPPPTNQESKYKVPVSNGIINGQRSSENNMSRPNQAPGSLYIPPLTKQESNAPQSPPWMQRQNSIPREVPVWIHRDTTQSPTYNQQPRIVQSQLENRDISSNQGGTRIIPIQIETSRPQQYNQNSSPLSPQSQQYQHQNYQYQQPNQQYQQPNQQYQQPNQQYQQPSQQYQQQNQSYQQPQQPNQQPQTQQQQRWPVYLPNKFNQPQSPTNENGGPIQSRSFKVLQKITDTDSNEGIRQDYPDASTYNTAGVPLSQLRKMHLSDDDKALMDKVKSQVDDDIFLHSEPDPRYRGAAIPSKAFRMLQSMTSGTTSYPFGVPRTSDAEAFGGNSPVRSGTPKHEQENGQARHFVPASQQEHVEEPRKYTGGTIPSRSFRMLQAMTVHPDRPGESEY